MLKTSSSLLLAAGLLLGFGITTLSEGSKYGWIFISMSLLILGLVTYLVVRTERREKKNK